MINILVHGLGQNESSWNKVKELLKENKIEVETPNLFNLAKNYQLNYENLYRMSLFAREFNKSEILSHPVREIQWSTLTIIIMTKSFSHEEL